MTDREMLEAAARSIGLNWQDWTQNAYDNPTPMQVLWPYDWNPLTDGDAALWLATEHQLTVCNEHLSCGEVYCVRGDDVFDSVTVDGGEEVTEADHAATLRAITQAAAAIWMERAGGV